MTDKINIIVERDGEFHKFVFGDDDCKTCSLHPGDGRCIDACDVCGALYGHFEKVDIK
jgi:hypothetical protein